VAERLNAPVLKLFGLGSTPRAKVLQKQPLNRQSVNG